LTYFSFSSSFICSARSWPVPLLADDGSGVAPLETRVFASFDLMSAVFFSAEPGGTTKGDTAIANYGEKELWHAGQEG
jgi:hypothetical protein